MTYLSLHRPMRTDLSDFDHIWSILDPFRPNQNPFDCLYQSSRFEVDETKDGYTLTMALPGFKRDEVAVKLEERHLSVCTQHKDKADGSKATDHVQRTVLLGSDIDSDTIQAKLEDGMLTVTVKKIARPQPRKIDIL